MVRFTVQPLKRSTPAGDTLRQTREERHLSIKNVAHKLNIPSHYLEALESGEWEALPRGDYGRYFLKQYALFLQLDIEELLAQYPGPNLPKIIQPPKHAPVNPIKSVHPLRRILLGLVAVVVITYLAIAARAIFLPPQLEVISPATDGTISFSPLTVSGITKPGTEVTVNNEVVEVMESGRFVVIVPLRPGLNNLVIKARKSLSREVTIERIIYYTPPPSPPVMEENKPLNQ